jgi:DNA-binding CsgD family transcriptional regulator
MKIRFLFLSILFNSFLGVGQLSYRDSLKDNLKNSENEKTYLYELCELEKQNYRLAVVYNQLGLLYQYESNLDSAMYCHKKALLYSSKVSVNNQEIGVSLNKIGVVYYYRGELDSAIIFFVKAIPYYDDQKLKANSLNNLALINKYNSNPDLAIANYILACDIYAKLGDTLKQVYVLNNIAGLYEGLDDLEKSESYCLEGLKLAGTAEKFKDGAFSCKSNLANIYNRRHQEDLAVPIFLELISHYEATKDYNFVIINKNNLAHSYDALGDKERALKLFKESLTLMKQTGIENNKEAVLINLGSCYEEQGEYKKALKHYKQAKEFALSNNLVLRYETIYTSLSSVYLKLDQADSSIYYKDLQIALKDSLDNIEKEKKMMELEAQYQSNKLNENLKNKDIELLDSKRKQRLTAKSLIYTLIIVLLTIVSVVFFYRKYQKENKRNKELETSGKKKKENIQKLKNTLNSKDEEIEKLSYLQEKGRLPYPKNLDKLTSREKEVLIGVKDGLKDKEIADRLFISITTVRTHLRKAYIKIDARNRAEAIQFISEYDINGS